LSRAGAGFSSQSTGRRRFGRGGLDRIAAPVHTARDQPAGRPLRTSVRGGKSGLHGETVPDNVRRGRPQGQCHREQTAFGEHAPREVRVKGCGKSAPRARQRGRHGKPHREQDRIGTTGAGREAWRRPAPGPSSGLVAGGGRQRPSQRNGRRVRGSRPGPYRTRLTGRLITPIRNVRLTLMASDRARAVASAPCPASLTPSGPHVNPRHPWLEDRSPAGRALRAPTAAAFGVPRGGIPADPFRSWCLPLIPAPQARAALQP
jgi:hypothetical protein